MRKIKIYVCNNQGVNLDFPPLNFAVHTLNSRNLRGTNFREYRILPKFVKINPKNQNFSPIRENKFHEFLPTAPFAKINLLETR